MERITRIAPSLLSADFARLGEEMRRAEKAGADWHHVDVMDGHFVPNLTVGAPVVSSLRKSTDLFLDVHLMIRDPWTFAGPFLDAGAEGLTFHAEAGEGGDFGALISEIQARGGRAGMAVNPETPIDPLLPWLDRLDLVLVMSVRPGFSGQAFMPEVLSKVRALRGRGYEGDLQMDGGIGRETVRSCAEAGCNIFVAGSALYGVEDMEGEIRLFRQRIREGQPA